MSLHPNGMIFMATPDGVITIAQTPLAWKGSVRRVPIGDSGGASLSTLIDLTGERDGRAVLIRGARHASVRDAFARIWLSASVISVPYGFGFVGGGARKPTAATVRARVRATHGSTVTMTLHGQESGTGKLLLLDRRTLPTGWIDYVFRAEGAGAIALLRGEAGVVLTWYGTGSITSTSVEIDVLEAGHEYTFWPERRQP
jgi:hypothetical protein